MGLNDVSKSPEKMRNRRMSGRWLLDTRPGVILLCWCFALFLFWRNAIYWPSSVIYETYGHRTHWMNAINRSDQVANPDANGSWAQTRCCHVTKDITIRFDSRYKNLKHTDKDIRIYADQNIGFNHTKQFQCKSITQNNTNHILVRLSSMPFRWKPNQSTVMGDERLKSEKISAAFLWKFVQMSHCMVRSVYRHNPSKFTW